MIAQSASSSSPAMKNSTKKARSNPNLPIDEFGMWEELSNFLPMLSYGEESKDLISSLLDLSTIKFGTAADDDDDDDAKAKEAEKEGCYKTTTCAKCKGQVVSEDECNTVQNKRNRLLANLATALQHMLETRTKMHHVAYQSSMHERYIQQESGSITNKLSTPTKRARLEVDQSEQKSHHHPSTEIILPWNVLLRIAIRMASSVSRQYHSCNNNNNNNLCKCLEAQGSSAGEEAALISRNNNVGELTAQGTTTKLPPTTTMHHPILQVMDIVLAELHVISRMQRSQQQDSQLSNRCITTPTKAVKGGHVVKDDDQSLQSQVVLPPKSQMMPRDRMLADWTRKPQPNSIAVYWGPSRHAILRDIESITKVIESDGESMMLSINSEEWHEKVQSLITAIDSCARAHMNQMLSLTPKKETQQQPSLALSPSLRRYDNSPRKTASIASIARAHVERVGSKLKAEKTLCKSEPPPPPFTKTNESHSEAGSVALNLQSVMDQEVAMKKENGDNINMETDEDETDELEDVYRMAIAVGSSSREDDELVQEMIERRLSLLAQMVIDPHNQQHAQCDSLNFDGAQSFLESLVHTLIQPSDPNVWLVLMEESQGQETPSMLRRGRTMLACFLVEIKAPGWEDCIKKLESSPVPSYLGYLSPQENFQSSSTTKEEIMKRSSYFLPAVESGETNLPASPIVTEIGLGLCMKNYLHKDTPEGSIKTSSSSRSSGISLFRNYGPLQYEQSCSSRSSLLDSIMSPLPNANELTRDLFDLTLRLAADEDDDHAKKPCALRLSTPSPSESLNIVLKVLIDYADWLSPHSIIQRYRFILQHLIQSFSGIGGDSVAKSASSVEADDSNFVTWSRRVSYLMKVTNTAGQGRISLYATQFMMILCARQIKQTQQASQRKKQPQFYHLLRLRQPSNFWNEIDKSQCIDYSSNLMASIFNLDFCESYLLPLSFHCSLLLASAPLPDKKCIGSTIQIKGYTSALSLLTILLSVLEVLADNGSLHDCVCAKWALQILSYSVNYFLYGEDYVGNDGSLYASSGIESSSDSMWNSIVCQLNRLCHGVWGKKRHDICGRGRYQDSSKSASECVLYEHIGDSSFGSRAAVLMPPLDVFMTSLIKFACTLRSSTESECITSFCQFIANQVLDRYANAIQPSLWATSECGNHVQTHQNSVSVISSWVRLLVSNLQMMVLDNKRNIEQIEQTKRVNGEEAVIENILADLTTPMVNDLHSHIMQRALHLKDASDNKDMQGAPLSEHVASIFVALHRYEVDAFLTKPSSAKTKRWGVYRQCLEKVFVLTPPITLFAGPSHASLSDSSVVALESIWNQYGQCNASHSISIMVASALHVNNTARISVVGEQHNKQEMERRYNKYSSQAKACITGTFDCFNDNGPEEESRANFNDLIRFVRRNLSLVGQETEAGLAWWNQMSRDLLSLLNENGFKDDKSRGRKPKGKNISKALSTLQSNLSAISAISTHSNRKNSYS